MERPVRPRIDMPASRLDIWLDVASTVGLVLTVAIVALSWGSLPERVPTHFGLSGAPNAWGSKNSILLFVVIPVVIYFGLGLLTRVPHVYNCPRKVTVENAPVMYPLGKSMVGWTNVEPLNRSTWVQAA